MMQIQNLQKLGITNGKVVAKVAFTEAEVRFKTTAFYW